MFIFFFLKIKYLDMLLILRVAKREIDFPWFICFKEKINKISIKFLKNRLRRSFKMKWCNLPSKWLTHKLIHYKQRHWMVMKVVNSSFLKFENFLNRIINIYFLLFAKINIKICSFSVLFSNLCLPQKATDSKP